MSIDVELRDAAVPSRPVPPPKTKRTVGMVVGAATFVWAVALVDANWDRFPALFTELPEYIGLMAQGIFQNPTQSPVDEYWTKSFNLMIESLQMAWIGTVIGAILSFPLAFAAASNVSPAPLVFVVRQLLNVIRAIPDLILAIALMLPIFGLGPVAGAMALGVGSIGTLGKLSSEAIEGIDSGPVEAVTSGGGSKIQVLRWGVLPQVLPEIVAFWLYRFEINIRASAILGVLGAGGIGSILSQLFNIREWERIGITLIVIIVVTIIIDQISAAVRRRIISGDPHARTRIAQADI